MTEDDKRGVVFIGAVTLLSVGVGAQFGWPFGLMVWGFITTALAFIAIGTRAANSD